MAADRQLSRDFWLHEFPCWQHATEEEVARLEETVNLILQPTRREWGEIVPTSWTRWRSGCVERAGAHADGGTVDFVPTEADMMDVFEWMATHLAPSFGELIYERNHIHVTRYGIGGKAQVLVEPIEGEYVAGFIFPRLLSWIVLGFVLALALARIKIG